jgi:urease accessory protein
MTKAESFAVQRASGVEGRLELAFAAAADGRTRLVECRQQPPLKVVRAFEQPDGAAMVHLHNVSGGVLGGDQLELTINVGKQASAQVTTTGATRIYRCVDSSSTSQQLTHVRVGECGLLEYVPDALIPFSSSRYRQDTTIELADGAGLFWWETISPGREASGEIFAYQRLEIRLNIFAPNRRIASEQVRFEPSLRSPASPARLGRFLYCTTFYICRVGLENTRWLELENQLNELANSISDPRRVLWAASALSAHGLAVRALSMSYLDIVSGLARFWSAAKRNLYNREAIPPRKTP